MNNYNENNSINSSLVSNQNSQVNLPPNDKNIVMTKKSNNIQSTSLYKELNEKSITSEN